MFSFRVVALSVILSVTFAINVNAKDNDFSPLANHTDKWLCANHKPFVNSAFTNQFSQKEIRSEMDSRHLKCGFSGVWFCMKDC